MNLLMRSSSWLRPGGHRLLRAHFVSTIDLTASFSSLAAQICSSDLKNTKPEPMMSHPSSYHKIFHHLEISKTQSFEATLKYFDSIPKGLRDFRFCSLFSAFYEQARHLRLARCLNLAGLVKAEIPYDVNRKADCVKLDVLIQETEQEFSECEIFTLNTRLYAYVAHSDIEGMEKFLTKMEADPRIETDCNSYIIAANGYLEAGLVDQVVKMMNKSEQVIHGESESFCFETLLAFYTEIIVDKAQVYRVWNLYKQMRKPRYDRSCYMCMISSLLKFDDLDGAEKIFEETHSRYYEFFDIRIPNMMMDAYSRKGLWEKAEECVHTMVERGNMPDAASWDHLAAAYLVAGQMTKAVNAIKKAVFASSKEEWRLNPYFEPVSLRTLFVCFKYLMSKGDAEEAELDEIWCMITEHPHFIELMKGNTEEEVKDAEDVFWKLSDHLGFPPNTKKPMTDEELLDLDILRLGDENHRDFLEKSGFYSGKEKPSKFCWI